MRIDRRELLTLFGGLAVASCGWPRLAMAGSAPMAGAAPVFGSMAAAGAPDVAALRALIRGGLVHDDVTGLTSVFGLGLAAADEVLLRATKTDALPVAYTPRDLVVASARGIASAGRQLLRAVAIDDTRALVDAAAEAGFRLYVGSGFRSQAYQEDVFTAQTARWGDEEVANRYSARPGHSQHQLGTTIDFTTDFRNFRSSGAAEWLRENAARFGFVLPYTVAATERTGYIDEPWHARWVGQDLAALLQSLGYQEWSELDADDVVALVRAEAGLDSQAQALTLS